MDVSCDDAKIMQSLLAKFHQCAYRVLAHAMSCQMQAFGQEPLLNFFMELFTPGRKPKFEIRNKYEKRGVETLMTPCLLNAHEWNLCFLQRFDFDFRCSNVSMF